MLAWGNHNHPHMCMRTKWNVSEIDETTRQSNNKNNNQTPSMSSHLNRYVSSVICFSRDTHTHIHTHTKKKGKMQRHAMLMLGERNQAKK